MKRKSCFFIGHRETSDSIYQKLCLEIERHIVQYGVWDFYVGHYGGFDRLTAKALVETKKKYPQMSLYMVLPYHPSERPVQLPKGFDGSFFPEGQELALPRFAIVEANHYMINHVDFLIAYVRHPGSNARTLMELAKRKENIHVTNLAERNQE